MPSLLHIAMAMTAEVLTMKTMMKMKMMMSKRASSSNKKKKKQKKKKKKKKKQQLCWVMLLQSSLWWLTLTGGRPAATLACEFLKLAAAQATLSFHCCRTTSASFQCALCGLM